MKQKLALACTLIHAPEVLLLDEPTTGVDPISRVELWDILIELRREGTTILVSTPYMDEADKCDSIIILQDGKVLDRGSSIELRRRFPDKILEVEAEPLGRALRVLDESALVKSVVPFGKRLHLTMPASQADRRPIFDLLDKAGIRVGNISITQPSMEDVFVALTPGESGQ
jgi:ABC-2 type transport system ATP-binding protein